MQAPTSSQRSASELNGDAHLLPRIAVFRLKRGRARQHGDLDPQQGSVNSVSFGRKLQDWSFSAANGNFITHWCS